MSDAMFRVVLLANLSSTLFMTGLIWFVQIVHYPLFAGVSEVQFAAYERNHSQLTSFVVGPPMLLELATTVALVFMAHGRSSSRALWAGFALLAVIWLSTALLQVPAHAILEAGFNSSVHRRLVTSNWIRTFAWTLRSCIALFLVWERMAD